MIRLNKSNNKEKGMVLILTFLVASILLILTAGFFLRSLNERRLINMRTDLERALRNAERGIEYAYLESAREGWTWFTHDWKEDLEKAVPKASPPSFVRNDAHIVTTTSDPCGFLNDNEAVNPSDDPDFGCYAANDCTFVLKTFSDPNVRNMTVVRVKGRSGNAVRILEYRISRSAIYDYAWWTPYDLSLGSVGNYVNGGRIHANGNIYISDSSLRLYGVDIISTGKDKSIYYSSSTYYCPGCYDYYVDGSKKTDGIIPLPSLEKPNIFLGGSAYVKSWAGTTDDLPITTQAPWIYKDGSIYKWWNSSYGEDYTSWPARWLLDEEFRFYGDSNAINYINAPRYSWAKDISVGGYLGNTTYQLNKYNTWIYPAQKDEKGEIIFGSSNTVLLWDPQEIPAELEGAYWDWKKYNYYGKFGSYNQVPVSFSVYDPNTGQAIPEEQTRWKLVDTNNDGLYEVVRTSLDDPEGKRYWDMLTSYDYWYSYLKSLGKTNSEANYYATLYSSHINPEILDGRYGDDLSQVTIKVDNTNSIKQPERWNQFLKETGLYNVLFANEYGENMESPRFATTYKDKCITDGLYFSKSRDEEIVLHYGNATKKKYKPHVCPEYDPNTMNYDTWLDCVEKAVDKLVEVLNTDEEGKPLPENKQSARKVRFINTYTNKWSVVLELDLGKMQNAGIYPSNGIIYSEVPIRLSNAKKLPCKNPKEGTFNVISEENIYLKGDYNNPAVDKDWLPSAVISRKQIYTLSDNFNDPQVSPAFRFYPNWPYVYVKENEDGTITELAPGEPGGIWRCYSDYIKDSPQYNTLIALRNAIQNDWYNTFNKDDPSGSNLYTVNSSHKIIDGQTWGAMPNLVKQNHTYNALFASYYNGSSAGIPYGVSLERWGEGWWANTNTKTKTLMGAFFQLDHGLKPDSTEDETSFCANQPKYGPVDTISKYPNNKINVAPIDDRKDKARPLGGPAWGPYFCSDPNIKKAYDSRFRNPLYSQNRPIFFGGGEASWREIDQTLY